jgi:hypothetical protein
VIVAEGIEGSKYARYEIPENDGVAQKDQLGIMFSEEIDGSEATDR